MQREFPGKICLPGQDMQNDERIRVKRQKAVDLCILETQRPGHQETI